MDFSIRLGTCNVHLIEAESGYVLVDAGNKGKVEVFLKALRKRGVDPGQIKLIVVTHVHYDHVGSLAAIKRATGAKVAVHALEAPLLAEGRIVIPPGTGLLGNAVSKLGRALGPGPFRFEPVVPDIIFEEETNLDQWGAPGKVVLTPGHTPGSISYLPGDGRAFIGDVNVHFPWPPNGVIMPPFAEDVPRLFITWRDLLVRGLHILYPAHGKPFPIERLRLEYQHRTKNP